MKVSEAIANRRAVKLFDPIHVMPEDIFSAIMENALKAPSAFNLQHWRIVRVKDLEQRQKIQQAAYGQKQTVDASELLVICFDEAAWKREPFICWNNVDEERKSNLKKMVHSYYDGKPRVQRDEGMRSSGIFVQTLMLIAREYGYDTCPMDGFDFEEVAEIINLPEDFEIGLMVAIGKAKEAPPQKTGQLKIPDTIFIDRF